MRSLVREGHSPKEAARQLQSLNAAHGESSRDRMRQIFNDVPVIYGFSSTAPLGPVAGATLSRYLRAAGEREIAQSRPSQRLLDAFAPFGMAATRGMTGKDPHIEAREDMCQFADDRLSNATKLAFVHEILLRHIGEARLNLDRIQRLTASLDERTFVEVIHPPAILERDRSGIVSLRGPGVGSGSKGIEHRQRRDHA